MFKPEQKAFKEKELMPEGTYVARLYSFVDIGSHEREITNDDGDKEMRTQHKVRLTFELPTETREFDGVQKPLVMGKDYTFSMHEKASLRSVVHALLGETLSDPAAYDFDFEGNIQLLLGRPCMVSVSHFKGADRTFAFIKSVVPLVKGMECPPQFNESVFYLMSHGGNETYESLPEFIRKKIGESKESGISESVRSLRESHNSKVEITPDDIPF